MTVPRYLPGCGPDCPCQYRPKGWPPQRVIFSTGDRYTVREVAPGLFEYVYLAAEAGA